MQMSSFTTHDKAVTGILVQACTHFETQTPDESSDHANNRASKQRIEGASKEAAKQQLTQHQAKRTKACFLRKSTARTSPSRRQAS